MKKIIGQSKEKNLFCGIPQKFSVEFLKKKAIINLMDRLDRIKELVEKKTKEEEIAYKLASLEEKEREEILAQVEREDPELAKRLRKRIEEIGMYSFLDLNWVRRRYSEWGIYSGIALSIFSVLTLSGILLYWAGVIKEQFYVFFLPLILSWLIAIPIYLLLPRKIKAKILRYYLKEDIRLK